MYTTVSIKPQSQFLTAAYEVLSKARRSMHYTQIASVGQRLGVLQSNSASIEITMSSLLSEDIRTNPDSLFVKKRPGVYALSSKGLAGSPNSESSDTSASSYIDYLQVRSGLADRTATVNRALYLAQRTVDMAGPSGLLFYISLDRNQSIEISIGDLLDEFTSTTDRQTLMLINGNSQAIVERARRIARHLDVDDLSLVIQMSLFLLDLAIDLVGMDNVLIMQSANSSIRVPVRTGKQHAS